MVTNVQAGRPSRRALSEINQNLRGDGDNYHCVVNKRGHAENGAHRPITRRYAAQMEAKKPRTEFIVWEDVPLVESENHSAVPMSLEQSEGSTMKEVEMEDIFEDPVIDIDAEHSRDPLAVVDYIQDLYSYYKKVEHSNRVSPIYMVNQFDINDKMRAILIDWLIEVHHKFELRRETLFLTVNLIDRFLATQSVSRKKLQLVGLVAMLLACKYEEVSVPIVDDLVFISDKAYSRREVLELEKLMLNSLQFNLSVATPYVFLTRFLRAAAQAKCDQKLELLAFFFSELCLVEYAMLKYTPSFLAAAAIYAAQATVYGVGQWSRTCEWHSGYSEEELMGCVKEMVGFHERAGTGKLTGVYRKYNSSKLGFVARCEPALFLVREGQYSSPGLLH